MSYESCLSSSRDRYNKGDLKLCPEGYCTAKKKFKVYPSAYANGYAVQVCSGRKPDFRGQKANFYDNMIKKGNSDLSRWYREQWANVCEKDVDGEYLPCGRHKARLEKEDYPYCRPLYKLKGTSVKSVGELSKSELDEMCKRKRSITPGSPTRVYIRQLEQTGPQKD